MFLGVKESFDIRNDFLGVVKAIRMINEYSTLPLANRFLNRQRHPHIFERGAGIHKIEGRGLVTIGGLVKNDEHIPDIDEYPHLEDEGTDGSSSSVAVRIETIRVS